MSVYATNNQCPYRASVSGSLSESEPAPPLPSRLQQQDNNLLKVFSSLFESGKYSDLVIKCQGQRWKTHRAVVCTQSRPLAAAIDGNFRESATGEINLEEDEPQIIGFMLEYFYKGDVSINANVGSSESPIDLDPIPSTSGPPPVPQSTQQYTQVAPQFANTSIFVGFHTPVQNPGPPLAYGNSWNMMQAANAWPPPVPPPPYPPVRNAVSGLPDFSNEQPAVDAPQTAVKTPANPQNLITLAAIYIAADKYDVQPLKLLAITKYEALLATAWNTKHFVESLELIYDGLPEMSEPDMLRDLAIKTAASHAKELMDRGEFMTLFQERGDFATDVFKASLEQNQAQASPTLTSDVGSGIPRCWNNSSHAVNAMYASRTYPYSPNQPSVLRYKCAVCNTFIDYI
ncbi:hypothetical protein N431DRAFT_489042 [Stipitochalara longipes BDJ]|nr:hypothetical protein N431DRAFT_489042 [Stipitochalara longipes BDJ]